MELLGKESLIELKILKDHCDNQLKYYQEFRNNIKYKEKLKKYKQKSEEIRDIIDNILFGEI